MSLEFLYKLPKDLQIEISENVMREDFTEEAKAKFQKKLQKELKKFTHPGARTDIKKTSAKYLAEVGDKRVLNTIGKLFEESGETVRKRIIIFDTIENKPEKFKRLKQSVNTKATSLNSAYHSIKNEIKKEEAKTNIRRTQVSLPDTVQLYQKKFQSLEIKPNSVSLIFTDPPYAEKYLHLYDDLGRQAIKVLRDGGSLLSYAGHFAIGRIINMMEKHGLKFHWPLVVYHSGPSASVFGYRVLVGYKPLLWFTKGKYEGEFVKDIIKSEFQGKELHEWAQSTVESDYYIKYMTIPNDIVYDPFMGQGTFGVSAVKLKRQFIGAEIDATHFKNAQRLLTNASKTR